MVFLPLPPPHAQLLYFSFPLVFALDTDEYTTRLHGLADEWVHVHAMTEQMISERLRKDQIDIAVDLAGAIASH